MFLLKTISEKILLKDFLSAMENIFWKINFILAAGLLATDVALKTALPVETITKMTQRAKSPTAPQVLFLPVMQINFGIFFVYQEACKFKFFTLLYNQILHLTMKL